MAKRKETFTDTQRRAAFRKHPTLALDVRDLDFDILNVPAHLPMKEMRQTFERFAAQRQRAADRNKGEDADKAKAYQAQSDALLAVSVLFRTEMMDSLRAAEAKKASKKATTADATSVSA